MGRLLRATESTCRTEQALGKRMMYEVEGANGPISDSKPEHSYNLPKSLQRYRRIMLRFPFGNPKPTPLTCFLDKKCTGPRP